MPQQNSGKNKKKGGQKKYGRDKLKCSEYRRLFKREKNKIKKILRHLKKHKNDMMSLKVLLKLKERIK